MSRSATLFKLTGIIDIKDNGATQKLKNVERQSKKTSKSVKGFGASAGNTSSATDSMTSALTGAIGKFASIAGAIMIATKALMSYAKIQTEVAQLGTLFVGNTKQANKLAAATKKIGQELGIDQVTALSAAYKVVSTQLGKTEEEYEAATRAGLELARVGRAVGQSLDVTGVINLLSTEIRAFGMDATDITTVSEKLFKTIQLGNTDINQLASSLPQVSAVAHDAGVSFNELLAIIAGASKVIPDNVQITSSLTTAIAQLQNGTAGVGKKFEKTFGMRFKDAIKKTGSLTNVLVEFDKRLKASGSSLAEAFGVRGLKGISAIVAVSKDINESLAQINDSAGLVKEGIAQLGEQGGLSFGQMKVQIESALATLGSGFAPLLPVIAKLFESIATVVRPLAEMLATVLAPIMKVISGVLGEISGVISSLFTALQPIVELLGRLFGMFLKMNPIMMSFHMIAQLLTGVFKALASPIQMITNLFDTLLDALEPIMEIFDMLGELFSDILNPVMSAFSGILSTLKPLFMALKPVLQVIGYIMKGIGFVLKGIVWLAAKAIDLTTKMLTLGFGGTHLADEVEKSFSKHSFKKADVMLDKGGASKSKLDAATAQGKVAASSLKGNTQQGSSSSSVVQHIAFTQPQASVEDIQRGMRTASRSATSEINSQS